MIAWDFSALQAVVAKKAVELAKILEQLPVDPVFRRHVFARDVAKGFRCRSIRALNSSIRVEMLLKSVNA